MVLPISGPFLENFTTNVGVGSVWWTRQVYRQQRPYNLSLIYSRDDRGVGIDTGWGSLSSSSNTQHADVYGTRSPMRYTDLPSWFVTSVTNQARERLQGKIKSEALLLATLAEARQNIHQMADRLDQARRIVKQLPPFLYHGLLRATLVAEAGRYVVRGVGKKFADGVLEVFFGYMPIMSDVQSCAETLSKDFSPIGIDASAKRKDSKLSGVQNIPTLWWRKDEQWWLKVKCGCTCQVTNPNMFLADSIGLVNPFATVWELLPWSFVVDYFVNVNQFIGALTADYGVSLSEPFTRNNCWSFAQYENRDFNPVTKALLGGYSTGIWARGNRSSRSLPSVRLGVRQLSLGKDLSRLVTSGALLLQALTRR